MSQPSEDIQSASMQTASGQASVDGTKPPNVQMPLQFRAPLPVMPLRPGMPPPSSHLGQMPFVSPNFRHMLMPFVSASFFCIL